MEVDPVILQLRADVQKYRAELLSTTNMVDSALKRQERAVIDLERQIRASSGQIAGHLRGLAGAFAGAFSVQQIKGAIDGYTRVQNALRVAGLEGESLADVQAKLLDLSTRYGVSLESLAGLFGNATQAGQEMGASQAQIMALTEATSQALLITGTSATQASGAILGLTQALASGTVRAEEYNQINEGGLRPLLQLVANTDRFGGSMGKLRMAVTDGKVSSQEFFQAISSGSAQLQEQASKATLTLSGAMEALSSRFTVYIGQSAQANGLTAALSGGIMLLADNLDTLSNVLAVIVAVMGGRYVAALVASAASSIALTAATAGTTTALGTLAAVARTAGASLLAAFGGPIGIAVAALTLGIGYLVTQESELDKATGEVAEQQAKLAGITHKARSAIDRLATATGNARTEALANAKAVREETLQYLAQAKAATQAAAAKSAAARRAAQSALDEATAKTGRGFEGQLGANQGAFDSQRSARANLIQAIKNEREAQAAVDALSKAIADPPPVATGGTGDGKPKPKPKGRTGPSAQEIEQDHQSALRRIYADRLQDELAITADAERRREIMAELDGIEFEERRAQIENDKNFTKEQKAAQIKALQDRYGMGLVDGEYVAAPTPLATARAREERDAIARVKAQELRDEQDTLAAQADLLDDRRARAAIEARILELKHQEERLLLETAIANKQVADVAKARANLEARQAAERTGLERAGESPIQRYARGLNRTDGQLRDQAEALVVDKLQSVEDGITDALSRAIGTKDPMIAGLIRLLVQEVLMKPIANALKQAQEAGGGGGSFFSSLVSAAGTIFGRASGGYVGPGQVVRVNEQAGGVELLKMGSQGGKVIPLGQARAQRGGGMVQKVYNINISAENSVTPAGFAQGLAQQILAEAARMDAQASKATRRQSIGDQAYFQDTGNVR